MNYYNFQSKIQPYKRKIFKSNSESLRIKLLESDLEVSRISKEFIPYQSIVIK